MLEHDEQIPGSDPREVLKAVLMITTGLKAMPEGHALITALKIMPQASLDLVRRCVGVAHQTENTQAMYSRLFISVSTPLLDELKKLLDKLDDELEWRKLG